MAGISISRSQLRNANETFNHIITDLTSGGGQNWFAVINGSQADLTGHDVSPTLRHVLLESRAAVDSMITPEDNQSYRMFFEVTKNTANPAMITQVRMYVGSNQQLTADANGVVSRTLDTPETIIWDSATQPTPLRETNLRFTLTDHGFAMAMWTVVSVNTVERNLLVVIQRPVNPITGAVKIDGNAPLFMLSHGSASLQNFFQFTTVRERFLASTQPFTPTQDPGPYNMYKVTLDWTHPNLFDNFTHIIKFPYGFCTNDHIYMEELDLIAIVNGTAFASNQEVEITMYGESTERKYTTAWGDVEYGRLNEQPTGNNPDIPKIIGGGRIALLSAGGALSE